MKNNNKEKQIKQKQKKKRRGKLAFRTQKHEINAGDK
jgi:hypothetical protein